MTGHRAQRPQSHVRSRSIRLRAAFGRLALTTEPVAPKEDAYAQGAIAVSVGGNHRNLMTRERRTKTSRGKPGEPARCARPAASPQPRFHRHPRQAPFAGPGTEVLR